MKLFSNMKIGRRLGLAFGGVLAMMVCLGILSINRLSAVDQAIEKIVNDRFPKVIISGDIGENTNLIARAIRNMLLLEKKEDIQKEAARIADARKKTTEAIESLSKTVKSEKGTELLKSLKDVRTTYDSMLNDAMKMAVEGKKKEGIDFLVNKVRPVQTKYFDTADAIAVYQKKLVDEEGKKANELYKNVRNLIIAVLLVSAIIGFGIAILITRSITKPISASVAIADKVASGDMSMEIQTGQNDETGQLMGAMKGMVERIRAMVVDVDMMSRAAVEGKLRLRADASKHEGDYRKIVDGVNRTLDSVVGFIDSMPIPAMVVDSSFGIQYMNGTGASILGRTPEQLVGEKCYNHFKTSDCNTDKCACGRAMRLGSAATSETDAHPSGMDLEIQYTGVPVKDMNGAIIGAFEVVVDQTAVKKAARIARKVADYQEAETQKVKEALNRLSDGDLTFSIHAGDADADAAHVKQSFSEIAEAMNRSIETLRNLISQTTESSNQVSAAADQISDASQNFSQKITEQAAAVEETSATVEEMSASIKQTAENSREANKLAQGTKALADSGSQVMGDTIKAIDEINKSSSKIANISNVIEEIAFQTNLLALNAAVEAARAGEHGKGFAVVASEIRSLAGRTTASAKEINALIEDSVEKTGRGVQLAQELSKKLEEIGGSIRKVTDLMNEVAAAAAEQATGTNQVNTAMTQIDQTTQQNASLVEETSAAAEELAAQAKDLLNVISFFRIGEERSAPERQQVSTKRLPKGGERTLAGHQAASGLHTTKTIKHARLAADHKYPNMASSVADGHNGHNGHDNGFEEF